LSAAAALASRSELRLGRFRAVAYRGAMRGGALVSALAHAGVLVWVLLGTPKSFDAATGEPVTVDLVTPDQVPREAPKPPETPEPPKPLAETKPLLIPPRPTTVTETPRPALTSPPQTQAPAPRPPAQPPQPPAAQRSAPPPPTPATQPQRNAAAPPNPAPPPPAQEHPSIFDPASIPKLLDIAPVPPPSAAAAPEYDALADVAAALSQQEVTAFKAHLKRCLKLPAGVDPARELRVVMRVFLKADGALAADPMLVAAPAAREGPAMVQAATQAFKDCQPYALPAARYNEWKTLDITLSLRDMAGG
jgi:hypothetical protein